MKIFKLFTLILLFSFTSISCGRSNADKKKQDQLQLFLYIQNNHSPTSSYQSTCFDFVSTENTCIVVPDNQLSTCSDSELSRIKKGIQPTESQTEPVLSAFFNCWKKCAILFNVTNSICTNAKFTTTKTYREAQKSTSSTASATWGACMTKCNNGASEEDGLKGKGITYPTQPF